MFKCIHYKFALEKGVELMNHLHKRGKDGVNKLVSISIKTSRFYLKILSTVSSSPHMRPYKFINSKYTCLDKVLSELQCLTWNIVTSYLWHIWW